MIYYGSMFLLFTLPAVFLICAIAGYTFWSRWRDHRVLETVDWPEAEGTIQSAEIQKFGGPKAPVYFYPCFEFSYVVNGEYYSGRFGLAVEDDPADGLITEMIDRKLTVCYKPGDPTAYYIPNELIEGYEVLQKRSANDQPYYPTD